MKSNRFAFIAAALLLLAGSCDLAAAQVLGAPNSTVSQIGGQTKDHVSFTGGNMDGVVIGATTPAAVTTNSLTATAGTISGVTVTQPGTGEVFSGSTSGTTTLKASAIAGSTTQTLPPVTGTVASTTGSNLAITDIYRTSAAVTANGTITYANVTGLSGTVVPGTYRFRVILPSTVASGTGGIKYAFNYTTTVLSAIESTARGYTASAVAVQHTTTTTTQTDLFTQAAVVIFTEINGTMVVTTGGTIDVQMAQNTSNGSNTVALVGGSLELTRIQ